LENLFIHFNAKEGKEDIFKLTTGNESIYETSNDNGARIVNLTTSYQLPTAGFNKLVAYRPHEKKIFVFVIYLLACFPIVISMLAVCQSPPPPLTSECPNQSL
jgi:hypothetical protein